MHARLALCARVAPATAFDASLGWKAKRSSTAWPKGWRSVRGFWTFDERVKQWMNQGAFLMRRLENVRGEFSLTALAYNIRRAITIVGIPGMIAARQAWD